MDTIGVKYKINIKYGYDELYPREEHEITEGRFHIPQIGDCDFENMIFYPEISDWFKFEFNKEYEVEHDIIVGLPVYIIISKLK